MSATETVESYLIQTGVAHEQIDDTTWVVQLDDARRSRIAVKIVEPILLFSTSILDVSPGAKNLEELYRTLLELNAELVHGAYALQGQRVVLSGTQQTASVDFNEFQATLDDMAMALDKHRERLGSWTAEAATN